MSGKNGLILRIVLGGFLAYQGIKLLSVPAADRPDNFIPLVVCAIVFIVIGAAFTVSTIRRYVREMKDTEIQAVSYEELKMKEEENDLCE